MSDRQPLESRVYDDQETVQVADGDLSTSDEAMRVLREQGVDAWREWVKQHADA